MIGPSLSVVHTPPSSRRKLAPALSSPPKPSEPSNRPGANHLKPTGAAYSRRSSFCATRVNHTAADQGLADGGLRRPFRAIREKITNGDGEEVIGIHQARGRSDNAMPVHIQVVSEGEAKYIHRVRTRLRHRIGTGTVHANLAVMVHRHERERWIKFRINDLDVQFVNMIDRLPQ